MSCDTNLLQLCLPDCCAPAEREAGQHGCEHYRRRCKLVAPCCNEVYWCRHCHNEAQLNNEPDVGKQHELDRTAVNEVVCALCDAQQPFAAACHRCGVHFGVYTCLQCRFFDDDSSKGQFHCSECGICRVGGQANYFHCPTCACCYALALQGNHVCVSDSMKQNCPVCFEYLFDSMRQTSVLRCGHTIHSDCLQELSENDQSTCPICMRSIADLGAAWQMRDAEIARVPMPEEYAHWRVQILCNDCSSRSTAAFHIFGHKCGACGSYNTRRIAAEQQPPES